MNIFFTKMALIWLSKIVYNFLRKYFAPQKTETGCSVSEPELPLVCGLPHKTWNHVFSFCNRWEIYYIRQTCRSWYHLLKKREIRLPPEITFEKNLQKIPYKGDFSVATYEWTGDEYYDGYSR